MAFQTVGDSSPMVGVACFRNSRLCNACSLLERKTSSSSLLSMLLLSSDSSPDVSSAALRAL
ncbi:hypothetical protein Taro_051117, partial [Colocasia esculenta]|nr:hypothetical protein [Colocasia esculenta]